MVNAVIPANVIAGFKTCGVYPFNRSAIKVQESKKDDSTSGASNAGGNTESCATTSDCTAEDNAAGSQAVLTPAVPKPFTAEQEALFKRRFEEGYDVYIDKVILYQVDQCESSRIPCSTGFDTCNT